MDKISEFKMTDLDKSKYMKPVRIDYCQNGARKQWDALKVHDSIVIVIFNVTRKVLVFVKQFRPAVYLCLAESEEKNGVRYIDTTKHPGSVGVTYELCAGIMDKAVPPLEAAQDEVLEECGYKVPAENLKLVTTYRSGVGHSCANQMMFYAEVTDEMRVSAGGGLVDEGEMIEVVEIPVVDGQKLIMDETVNKPVAMMFGLMWFYQNIWNKDP